MSINYVTGDAIETERDGPTILCHVTNDSGGWGRGFVVPLGKKWPEAERAYRRRKPNLGSVQFIRVEPLTIVANMCAQHGYEPPTPLSYEALEQCLKIVKNYSLWRREAFGGDPAIHMPRIGAGLGGGRWSRIEAIIETTLDGLDVTVFTLPGPAGRWL